MRPECRLCAAEFDLGTDREPPVEPPDGEPSERPWATNRRVLEVPAHMLEKCRWKVIDARTWTHTEHIEMLEARAQSQAFSALPVASHEKQTSTDSTWPCPETEFPELFNSSLVSPSEETRRTHGGSWQRALDRLASINTRRSRPSSLLTRKRSILPRGSTVQPRMPIPSSCVSNCFENRLHVNLREREGLEKCAHGSRTVRQELVKQLTTIELPW